MSWDFRGTPDLMLHHCRLHFLYQRFDSRNQAEQLLLTCVSVRGEVLLFVLSCVGTWYSGTRLI